MDSKLKNSGTAWLGLTLVALAMAGLMAQIHPQNAAAMPISMDALAGDAVSQPALGSARAGQASSPAQDGVPHRRPALSMPYFSFARLFRPGS